MNILNGKEVADKIINQIKDSIDEHINESKLKLGYTIAKPISSGTTGGANWFVTIGGNVSPFGDTDAEALLALYR